MARTVTSKRADDGGEQRPGGRAQGPEFGELGLDGLPYAVPSVWALDCGMSVVMIRSSRSECELERIEACPSLERYSTASLRSAP